MKLGLGAVLTAMALVPPVGAAEVPQPVSPGAGTGVAVVADECPTFLWTSTQGAEAIDLAVYRVPGEETDEGAEGPLERVLAITLPGSADGWTPAQPECLKAGERYAWSVRADRGAISSDWSSPLLFEIDGSPSPAEVREALATLRRYLAETGGGESPPLAGAASTRATGRGSRDTLLSDTLGARSQGGLEALRVFVDGDAIAGISDGGGGVGVKGRSQKGGVAGDFRGYGDDSRGLHVVGRSCCDDGEFDDHGVGITFPGTQDDGDILGLRTFAPVPGAGTNFITFFAGAGTEVSLGAIQGDGSGGVELDGSVVGPSSDFAEYLPKADASDRLGPGEVVGLMHGKLSHRTAGAERAFVISTRPLVTGARPESAEASSFARVAFVGQAPVRVLGPAAAGDLLVPSGREDGTAVAVPAQDLIGDQLPLVIGRALEPAVGGSDGATVKTLVGLPDAAMAGGLAGASREIRLYRWMLAGLVLTWVGLRIGRWRLG